MKMFVFLPTLAALAIAVPAGAHPFIACDNKLRCVVAPCPSTNVLDVRTKRVSNGIYIDLNSMSAPDRHRVQSSNAAYDGTLVLDGTIAMRAVKTVSGQRRLPHLVATSILRRSSATEQRLCRAGHRP